MSSLNESIHEAVAERDAGQLKSLIISCEFTILSSSVDDEDQNVGAFIAEIDTIEALIVFSTDAIARSFVEGMKDPTGEDESIDGILIDGPSLLDYLPDDYGILLDAESENALIIEPDLIREIKNHA